MLYVIGLGLGDATDVTVKGLEIIRMSDRVYLESYTSILSIDLKDLEMNDSIFQRIRNDFMDVRYLRRIEN
uniref:diphthine methyl ester synthase n=1 Tax=Apis cerana TaxID=7461 RepID=V9ICM8_APICE